MCEVRPTSRSQALVWAALLVLVAFGGAGLAVAADRPHTAELRPELTALADRLFAPWRAEMTGRLEAVAEELATLAQAGRGAVGGLYRGKPGEVVSLLEAGEAASAATERGHAAQLDIRLRQAGVVPDWRLGSASRGWLARADHASAALEGVAAAWRSLAAAARGGAGLLKAARDHVQTIGRATTAARKDRASEALALLEQAAGTLQRMRELRDGLASMAPVAGLDELLSRHEAIEAAARALYDARAGGAAEGSAKVGALEEQLEQTMAQLPDETALRLIVADAAGPPLIEGLERIEQARGRVAEAIGAANTDDAHASP